VLCNKKLGVETKIYFSNLDAFSVVYFNVHCAGVTPELQLTELQHWFGGVASIRLLV